MSTFTKMNTKNYVQKYRLDDINFANRFNTDLFLQDLNEEMQNRIQVEKANRQKEGLEYSFRIFNQIITEMQNKFCAISNKKVGGPLRPQLWSAFYAKYIIPLRAKDFPQEHEKILNKRIRDKILQENKEVIAKYKREASLTGDNTYLNKLWDYIDKEVEKALKEAKERI